MQHLAARPCHTAQRIRAARCAPPAQPSYIVAEPAALEPRSTLARCRQQRAQGTRSGIAAIESPSTITSETEPAVNLTDTGRRGRCKAHRKLADACSPKLQNGVDANARLVRQPLLVRIRGAERWTAAERCTL